MERGTANIDAGLTGWRVGQDGAALVSIAVDCGWSGRRVDGMGTGDRVADGGSATSSGAGAGMGGG